MQSRVERMASPIDFHRLAADFSERTGRYVLNDLSQLVALHGPSLLVSVLVFYRVSHIYVSPIRSLETKRGASPGTRSYLSS